MTYGGWWEGGLAGEGLVALLTTARTQMVQLRTVLPYAGLSADASFDRQDGAPGAQMSKLRLCPSVRPTAELEVEATGELF